MASRHDAHVMQRGLPSNAPISTRVLLSLSPHVAPRTYCRCILYRIFIFIHHTQDCCGVFGLYGVGQEANRIGAHIMGQARIGILGSAIHTVCLCLSVCVSTSIPVSVSVLICVCVCVCVFVCVFV